MNLSFPFAQGRPASPAMTAPQPAARRAFTLIEMLVSLVITLIMMGAVVTLFGVMSDSVSGSRTGLEMADRLRAARNTLQDDLAGVTATLTPPLRPGNDQGYFEILEGPATDGLNLIEDSAAAVTHDDHLKLFGDTDDVLMFTTRAIRSPFTGKYRDVATGTDTIIESPVAEVAYFLVQNGPVIDAVTTPLLAPHVSPVRLYTLYRRRLLVAPDKPMPAPYEDYYCDYDVSARYHVRPNPDPPIMVGNTLGDLTKRENRFAHYGTIYNMFPFEVMSPYLNPVMPAARPPGAPDHNGLLRPMTDEASDDPLGTDVLLTNVVGFDVQVFDPGAPIFMRNGVALEPRDTGYSAAITASADVHGAYVDLGYGLPGYTATTPIPRFSGGPALKSLLTTRPFVYDTWSLHYEANGIDEDDGGAGLVDEGTNGIDDDGNGIVDDPDEMETAPPYSAPLRGIRVTIRVYEPNSKQIREAVVIQHFLPE